MFIYSGRSRPFQIYVEFTAFGPIPNRELKGILLLKILIFPLTSILTKKHEFKVEKCTINQV